MNKHDHQPTQQEHEQSLNPKQKDLSLAIGLWHSQSFTSYSFSHVAKNNQDLAILLLDWGKRYTKAALQHCLIQAHFKQKLLKQRYLCQHL